MYPTLFKINNLLQIIFQAVANDAIIIDINIFRTLQPEQLI
jgi:hypothetical protein